MIPAHPNFEYDLDYFGPEKATGFSLLTPGKREIIRNPKSNEYRKALKGIGERLTIAKQILAREEARALHSL